MTSFLNRGGTVNITSVYAQAAVRSILLKRCYGKFQTINKKTSVLEFLFWCFLVNFAKFERTESFLQNSTGRLLLIIAVSVVVKGVLAKERVNYDTKALRKKCQIVNVFLIKLLV